MLSSAFGATLHIYSLVLPIFSGFIAVLQT
jgi:hypothetical protein